MQPHNQEGAGNMILTYREFSRAPKHKREAIRIEQLRRQGGKCALCDLPVTPAERHRLVVDHCHATDKLRGLICQACNSAMAAIDRGDEWIRRAIAYRDQGTDRKSVV